MLNRFNPFKVLQIQDHEIRHSNVLSWLFSPMGNHNLDDRILKKFISKVLLNPDNDEKLDDVSFAYSFKKMQLSEIKVYRESHNIDILIVSESNRFVILIENKVYSGERPDQLAKYYNHISKAFKGYRIVPILLTLDGMEASHSNYFSASYNDVLESILFIVEYYGDRTSSEVLSFLNYYIAIIREKYALNDTSLKALCKEVYAKNKDVIDLIYSYGNEKDISEAIDIFKERNDGLVCISQKSLSFWFGIDEFIKARSDNHESWGGGFAVCFWFSEYYGDIKLVLEVGPFEDSSRRIQFLELLESNGIGISNRAKEPGRLYTRLYTERHRIKDIADASEVADAMQELYEESRLIQIRKAVVKAIDSFDWLK